MSSEIFGWGLNTNDQLTGQTGQTGIPSPFHLDGFTGTTGVVFQVSSGSDFSLAALTNNSIWGWGDNTTKQINGSTTNPIANPTQIVGFTGASIVTAISAGDNHSLALFSDNSLWGWGANISNQVNGPTATVSIAPPVKILGITGTIKEISAGVVYSLAVTTDNSIWGWGFNGNHQILGSTTSNILTPTIIPGFTGTTGNVLKVLAGDNFSLALFSDNTVWGWG